MGIEIAIGSIVGGAIAAAHAAAGAAVALAAAHPLLMLGGAALLTAGGAITGGIQKNNMYKQQARQMNMQADAEATQNAIEGEARARQLKQILASQNAMFGSSAISPNSGTASTIAGATYDESKRQGNQANIVSGMRQSIYGLQSDQYQSAGRASLINGFVGAGRSMLSLGMNLGMVGSVPSPSANLKLGDFENLPTVGIA